MKDFNLYDQIYICKYSKTLPVETIALDVGAHISDVQDILAKLKNNGLYNQYLALSDEEWEKADNKKKRKSHKVTIRLNEKEDKEIIDVINTEDEFGNKNISKNIKNFIEKGIKTKTKVDYLNDSTIEVPISIILNYYYLKGFLDGRENVKEINKKGRDEK